MSIEGKHSYRFGYLKSDKWQAVRLEALVREKAKCQICGEESVSNDAHHVWYPENIYETSERHLVVLCRGCHDFLHAMLPQCKTKDEESGLAMWKKFRNAVIVWRMEKSALFNEPEAVEALKSIGAGELRVAYDALKKKYKDQEAVLQHCKSELSKTGNYNQSIVPQIVLPVVPLLTEEETVPVKAAQLRKAYENLKARCRGLEALLIEYAAKLGIVPADSIIKPRDESLETQLAKVIKHITKWAKAYENSVSHVKENIAQMEIKK